MRVERCEVVDALCAFTINAQCSTLKQPSTTPPTSCVRQKSRQRFTTETRRHGGTEQSSARMTGTTLSKDEEDLTGSTGSTGFPHAVSAAETILWILFILSNRVTSTAHVRSRTEWSSPCLRGEFPTAAYFCDAHPTDFGGIGDGVRCCRSMSPVLVVVSRAGTGRIAHPTSAISPRTLTA